MSHLVILVLDSLEQCPSVLDAWEAAGAASTVLLAVKPQTMDDCLHGMKDVVGPSHLILSIAAGISTTFIE